jgi:capsular exopolysaccharide synthesis family protein
MSTIICGENKWQKCVRKSDLPGLDYITAGPVPPNPAELAFSNRVDEIFEELEDNYDVIIVDTPPIGIVTDALMNLHRANYPIYVFKAGVSKRSFIQNVNSLIEDKKLSNISIVFNGIDFRKNRITAYGYGYGYGYGYNYYTDEEDYVSPKWLKRFKSARFL